MADADLNGIMRGDSEMWRKQAQGMVAQTYAGQNRLRIYVAANTLTGAVVMGDQALSRPLQVLIREKVDISSMREKLLSPYHSLADTLTNFWEEYRQNHVEKIT